MKELLRCSLGSQKWFLNFLRLLSSELGLNTVMYSCSQAECKGYTWQIQEYKLQEYKRVCV